MAVAPPSRASRLPQEILATLSASIASKRAKRNAKPRYCEIVHGILGSMQNKVKEKQTAIKLRKQGKSYSEIMAVVPVAKSTLSLWLRNVGLSKKQNQLFTEKKRLAQLRGAEARHQDRLERTAIILHEAKQTVGKLTKRERLLIGAALYWAEGSKEKTYRPSVRLDFANSDPDMIRFHISWLREILGVADSDIQIVLHIHENRLDEIDDFRNYWLDATGLKRENYTKPVIKRHIPKTKRHNIADTYHGLVAIRVRRSTILNRRIMGWIHGIIADEVEQKKKKHCQIV